MKPQSNGLVEINTDKATKESGFHCMQLIRYLTEDNVVKWEDWENAHIEAASGKCSYISKCPLYERTLNKL